MKKSNNLPPRNDPDLKDIKQQINDLQQQVGRLSDIINQLTRLLQPINNNIKYM